MKAPRVTLRLSRNRARSALDWLADFEKMQDAGWDEAYPTEAEVVRGLRRQLAVALWCLHPTASIRCTVCRAEFTCGDAPHDEFGCLCPRCGSTKVETLP